LIRARRTPYKLRKLLVIDHEPTLFRDLLTPYGFEVLTAPDGEQATPLLEQNPDILLIIMEFEPPRIEEHGWLRRFRTMRKESPVIAICQKPKMEITDPDGPSVMVERPVDVAELLDLVGLFCGLGTPIAAAKA
jgi:DNA-binding response OmpR family regulator